MCWLNPACCWLMQNIMMSHWRWPLTLEIENVILHKCFYLPKCFWKTLLSMRWVQSSPHEVSQDHTLFIWDLPRPGSLKISTNLHVLILKKKKLCFGRKAQNIMRKVGCSSFIPWASWLLYRRIVAWLRFNVITLTNTKLLTWRHVTIRCWTAKPFE